jgi:4-amino-4-deoxy-L-arabinose transferase-like glycosyltransferase
MDAQNLIHKLEVSGGMRWLKWPFIGLLLVLLVVGYNLRGYRNFSTQEAMDSAQMARNLAQGRGFTTEFIRPFSMFLVKRHYLERHGAPALGELPDMTQIKGPHPDLANAPAYPVVLAGLMKVLPFQHGQSTAKTFWTQSGRCYRYQPDFLISAFNQLLLLGVVVLVYLLARRLFDNSVAWLSALLVLGNELFWRFSVSGISTALLMLIFMALIWCLVLLEAETREPRYGAAGLLALAVGAGLLTGLGALTRYSFGWLILPVLLYLLLVTGSARVKTASAALAAFLVVLAPWIIRNYSVSGTPFGVAGYAVLQSSAIFPENSLLCNLEPNLANFRPVHLLLKLGNNLRPVLGEDLPTLAGGWLSALALVGLLLSFNSAPVSRLRNFILACLPVLVVAQALGRTQLTVDSPVINSENLLVLLAPLVLIYGVHLIFLLLSQFEAVMREIRLVILGAIAVFGCLPILLVFTKVQNTSPVCWPPYYPPVTQMVSDWTRADDLTVSDQPWAVAWYADRPCLWLTTAADFLTVNDLQRNIQALFLTSLTLNSKFSMQWLGKGDTAWGNIVLQASGASGLAAKAWQQTNAAPVSLGVNQTLVGTPVAFPLHYWQPGWPDVVLLTARERSLKSP